MSLPKEAKATAGDTEDKVLEGMGENASKNSEETEERARNINDQTLRAADQLKEEIDRKVQQPQR